MSELFVIAQVGDQRIAFDAATVESVIDIDTIIPAPLAPGHVLGICAVRSQVLTVIDVAVVVGETDDHASTRAVVISLDGHSYAFCVTAVIDVAAQLGHSEPIDLNIGEGWHSVASARIATQGGFALVVDPQKLLILPRAMAA